MTSIIVVGKISSTWPMSLEKRFNIRPEGLVLKKYMAALVTPKYMALCNEVEDFMAKLKNSVVRVKEIIITIRLRAVNM